MFHIQHRLPNSIAYSSRHTTNIELPTSMVGFSIYSDIKKVYKYGMGKIETFPKIVLFESLERVRHIAHFIASLLLEHHEIPKRGGAELLDKLLMTEDISGSGDYQQEFTWTYPE